MDMKKETTKKAAKHGFNGKAIYNPKGKAGEYAPWACNFYTGCSNDCEYCYCKRGFLSHVWDDVPHLKKCFKDERKALEIFEKELVANLEALKATSLFFTFSSDPFLPGVKSTYWAAAACALSHGVRVQFLTKRADFVNDHFLIRNAIWKTHLAFGFTLTGCDGKEPGASTNQERIEAMRILHERGFKTFASIEPIVDFDSSLRMIKETIGFCDLYKIGLMSGVKNDYYDDEDVRAFIWRLAEYYCDYRNKIYIKQSIRDRIGENSVIDAISVSSDYDIFGRAKL
jgi:DNA repair photolyase